jgi:hypothetical protein
MQVKLFMEILILSIVTVAQKEFLMHKPMEELL